MSTSTDGARPSVPPGSDGDPGPHGPERDETASGVADGSDAERTEPSDPAWLREEILRRMADRPAGPGRHARQDSSMEETTPDLGRVPRHAVSTPGPGAAPPPPPAGSDADAVSRARAARPDDVWSRPPQAARPAPSPQAPPAPPPPQAGPPPVDPHPAPGGPQLRRDASPWVAADAPDTAPGDGSTGGAPPAPERPIGSPGLDARYARPVPRRTVPRAFARGARRTGPGEGPAVFGGPGFAEPAARQPHARPSGPAAWPGPPPADPPPRTVADAVREAGLRRADVPVDPHGPVTDPGLEELRYTPPRDPGSAGPGDPAPPTAAFRAAPGAAPDAAPRTEALRTTPADVTSRTEALPAAPATEALPAAPATEALPAGPSPNGMPAAPSPNGAPAAPSPNGAPAAPPPDGASATQAIPVAPDRRAHPGPPPAHDPRNAPARPAGPPPVPGGPPPRGPGFDGPGPRPPLPPRPPAPGFLPPRPADLDLPDATSGETYGGIDDERYDEGFDLGDDDVYGPDGSAVLWSATTPPLSSRPGPSPVDVPAPRTPEQAGLAAPDGRTADVADPDPERSDGADGDPEGTTVSRVKVVLSERRSGAHPVRTVVDIQEGGAVGELLRSNLISSQLAVALRFAIGAGLILGLLPLLFALFPEVGQFEVLGIRLPWLLLGGLVYPFLWAIGLWHTRTAERVEKNFADHVQD